MITEDHASVTDLTDSCLLVDAGERNPVDCAKKCLSEGFNGTGTINDIDNVKSSCNALTFQDGVRTLGCVEDTKGAHSEL